MAQILVLCIEARSKTRIMYKTNLSYVQLKSYLALLTSQGLLAHSSDKYLTTLKGQRFLEAFARLNDVLKDRGLVVSEESISESYEEVEIIHLKREITLKDLGSASRMLRKNDNENVRPQKL